MNNELADFTNQFCMTITLYAPPEIRQKNLLYKRKLTAFLPKNTRVKTKKIL